MIEQVDSTPWDRITADSGLSINEIKKAAKAVGLPFTKLEPILAGLVMTGFLEVDEDKRRISLGLKQLSENPWQVFEHTHNEGDKVSGAIKSITDFGVFIELEGGIDGLVHLSDISWDESEESVRSLNKGDVVDALVLSIESERERISLGMKQLESDSFGDYVETNSKGSRVNATIIDFSDERITLEADEIAQTETYDEESLHMRQLLKTRLIDMDLSVRALNCLKAAEVDTLGDLVSFNKSDLMKFRNFGKKSLTELEELVLVKGCLLYTSPSPRDRTRSRMPSSA